MHLSAILHVYDTFFVICSELMVSTERLTDEKAHQRSFQLTSHVEKVNVFFLTNLRSRGINKQTMVAGHKQTIYKETCPFVCSSLCVCQRRSYISVDEAPRFIEI